MIDKEGDVLGRDVPVLAELSTFGLQLDPYGLWGRPVLIRDFREISSGLRALKWKLVGTVRRTDGESGDYGDSSDVTLSASPVASISMLLLREWQV